MVAVIKEGPTFLGGHGVMGVLWTACSIGSQLLLFVLGILSVCMWVLMQLMLLAKPASAPN